MCKVENCNTHGRPNALQRRNHNENPNLCPHHYREKCEHKTVSRLPQSGKEYCSRCGKILTDLRDMNYNELKRLAAESDSYVPPNPTKHNLISVLKQ